MSEIVKPERIVLDHLVAPIYRNTMSFTDRSGKTELSWHGVIQTDTPSEKFRSFILEMNEQNFDRLDAHLRAVKS